MKTVHLAFAHRADDVRIYQKECASLAAAGYSVTYITAETESPVLSAGDSVSVKQLNIKRVGYSRLKHPVKHYKNSAAIKRAVYSAALAEKADVYHVHELMLLDVALKLKKAVGASIIYDAHEDAPRQEEDKAKGKNGLFRTGKRLSALLIELSENRRAKKCDAVITATPKIADRFKKIHDNVTCVCNYPQLRADYMKPDFKSDFACYIGMISENRGLLKVVDSFSGTGMRLKLAGNMPEALMKKCTASSGWGNVDFLGYIDRKHSDCIRREAFAGIVTFLPCGNHIAAMPNKIFEYMEAGLPVIASDFPLWKEIISGNDCGICVDPTDVNAIRAALKALFDDRQLAERLGSNGRKAVLEKYNWTTEKERLIKVYNDITE